MARNLTIWASAIALTLFAMSVALPWAAKRGYAGSVIENNYREGRDASGIFYTDVPNIHELETRIQAGR